MPAEIEEIIGNADSLFIENRFPNLHQFASSTLLDGSKRTGTTAPCLGTGKACRSILPLGIKGKLSSTTKSDGIIASGNFWLRKLLISCSSKEARIIWHHVRDQFGLTRLVLTKRDCHLLHFFALGNDGLNLLKLNAESPDLYLMIEASQEFKVAARQVTNQVSRFVQPISRVFR